MPIATPNRVREISVSNASEAGEPAGKGAMHWFKPTQGVPRFENFSKIRMLERTHTISLPMDLIKTQISTTPFVIRPTVDNPSTAHNEAADDIYEFFDGSYNSNFDPFSTFVKNWAHDTVSIDSGIVELVPRSDGWLGEIYNRDGAVFTKNPDDHGRLPMSDADEPAYYQFGETGSLGGMEIDPETGRTRDPLRELGMDAGGFQYGHHLKNPIPFTRDQIVWCEMNPAPWRQYGFGKVQEVERLASIILNQDVTNRKYFEENEVADGLLHILDANKDEIDRFRDYWKENVMGEQHVLPMAGGPEMDFIPFRPNPDELQFMESQRWYNQLVWFVFGLNQAEIGDVESINRSTIKELAVDVWRQTTKPLLDSFANHLNAGVLPYMEEYHRVDGEIEFAWEVDNPRLDELEKEKQRKELEAGTKTINELRIERGEDELPWGDIPSELMRSVARTFPGWALEQWGGVEDPPEPAQPSLLSAYGVGEQRSPEEADGEIIDVPPGGKPANDGDSGEGSEEDFSDSPEGEPAAYTESWFERALKSLRDEDWEFQYAPLAGISDQLTREVGAAIEELEPDIEEIIEEEFPEEDLDSDEFGTRPAIDDPLEDIRATLSDRLREIVVGRNLEAMQVSAEYHAEEIEAEAEERATSALREVGTISKDESVLLGTAFDVADTLAAEHMEREAAMRMSTVGQTVIERVRRTLLETAEDGGGVSAATEALRENIGELSSSHARLVGRTEVLQSGREGSQALCESSDLIGGKQWIATGQPNDGRTRSWHAAMNEEIVPVDSTFTVPSGWQGPPEYQPNDYPREARVVGEDQPFNCRCDQRAVLNEDMPEDLQSLNALDGVTARVVPNDLSVRQREIVLEHSELGESLGETIERFLDAEGGVSKTCDALGISTATLYDWGEDLGIERFAS